MTGQIGNLRDRVMGCWLGKAVGGTLGQSFEGLEGPLSVTFYDPVPTGMVPNDDLDLQVLWACVMAGLPRPRVDRQVLGRAWLDHVGFPWNEYGVAIRNMREGIAPPRSGGYDNWFTCGEGAAIRTELWACLAAGDPGLAARYAYEDACVDHAGDGLLAATFLAALQSAAFVESDPDRLLDLAVTTLPVASRLRQSVEDTRRWVAEGLAWPAVRERIIDRYGNDDMTDVRPNTAFVVLGWLAGGDFGERICICTNCGLDTDSSTASLGALLGILDPAGIGPEWLEPIGRDLVIRPEITGITPPPTLDAFTDLVLDLRDRLAGREPEPSEAPAPPPGAGEGLPAELVFTDEYAVHRYHLSRYMPPAHRPAPERTGRERVVRLDGTWHRLPREDFAGNVAIVRYHVELPAARTVRVLFNTPEQSRVWVDGEYVFGRETGGRQQPAAMFPSPAGPPLHQYADLPLAAGRHEVVAAVRRPPADRDAEWVVGLGDPDTGMWLPDVFRAPDGARSLIAAGREPRRR